MVGCADILRRFWESERHRVLSKLLELQAMHLHFEGRKRLMEREAPGTPDNWLNSESASELHPDSLEKNGKALGSEV